MPVRVQCACGKSFQVVDALIGKKVRCPACGTMVPVPGGVAPAGSGATAVTAQAKPTAATRGTTHGAAARKPAKAVPAFALSPRAVLLVCALVGVPLLIVLVKVGPIRAMAQWNDLEPKLRNYTDDVVRTVCMEQPPYKGAVFDQFLRPPEVTNVMIDGPILMLTLPAEVPVQGTSTEGRFKGTYFTREKRFEIDITVDGDVRTIKVKSHIDDKGRAVIDEEK